MNIYAAEITDSVAGLDIEAQIPRLSADRRERVKRLVSKEDARRSLLSELMIRRIICESVGISDQEIAFGFSRYGKPFLENNSHFHFNISHSGRWVTCVTDSAPAGIDIELVRPVRHDIARRFFSSAEYRYLLKKNKAKRSQYFFELWTLKESFVKMTGEGLSRPLGSFSVNIDGKGAVRPEGENIPEAIYFKRYSIDNDYKMCVCATHRGFPESVVVRDWDYFLGKNYDT